MKNRLSNLATCCSVLALSTLATFSQAESYAKTAKGQAFIQQMNGQFGYTSTQLTDILSHVHPDEAILRKISRPKEKTTPWYQYRRIFLDKQRISNGVTFYQTHHTVLNEAYEKYGVSPFIITAIIGVETRYGKFMGKERVITALATIGFDYPKREAFFTKELRAFLQMAAEEKFDVFDVYGSYAGAMGMAQFMPSSYLQFAVDYEGDGKRDLWDNPNDAIFSVANYLAKHGWQRDGEIVDNATINHDTGHTVDVVENSHKPFTTLSALKAKGVQPDHDTAFTDDTPVGFLLLQGEQGKRFWVTFNNFAVVTTYNTSPMYAMAVKELALAIESAL